MKKKMRRILALMLALALAAGLAACSGSSSESSATQETDTADTEEETGSEETDAAGEAEEESPAEEEEEEEEEEAAQAGGTVYKVGIVQYVDDASLNQIETAIEEELDVRGEELGVTFNYASYTYNGQADSTMMNQIAESLISDEVDIIVPIATPTALIMQSYTEDNAIPVVFSAVTDPVGAGLVESLDAPGANITGTSDAIDTEAIFQLMLAANPDVETVGLLYDNSQDSSTQSIADAKEFCDANGLEYVEKTGTDNTGIMQAADALVDAGVDAVFTPTDNTVQTAELAIYEKFIEAGIPHYAGADSFALNGAFCGYGVDYVLLGTETADLVVEVLCEGADPASLPVAKLDTGIATVNTETAEAIGLDYSMFEDLVTSLVEITTAEEFE